MKKAYTAGTAEATANSTLCQRMRVSAAMVRKTSTRMLAVPRSGCLRMSSAWDPGEHRGDEQILEASPLAARVVVEVLGQRDDQEQLHELAGLVLEAAEVDPAGRAAHVGGEDDDEDEVEDAEGVEHVAEALEVPVVEGEHEAGEDAADGEELDPADVELGPGALVDAGRAVEVGDAEEFDERHRDEERPVEVLADAGREGLGLDYGEGPLRAWADPGPEAGGLEEPGGWEERKARGVLKNWWYARPPRRRRAPRLPPKPPCSTMATTATSGDFTGA